MRLADRLRRPSSRRRRRVSRVGVAAFDLDGTAPDGSPAAVAMDGRWVVLLFLTSSCDGCQALWTGLAATDGAAGDEAAGLARTLVIVVTPDRSTESARRVAQLAAPGIEVVMSSAAWHAFGVTKAPWCAVVAAGVTVAEGPAPPTWDGMESLIRPGRT